MMLAAVHAAVCDQLVRIAARNQAVDDHGLQDLGKAQPVVWNMRGDGLQAIAWAI